MEQQVKEKSQAAAADDDFEPRIVAFLCKWCSSAGSDLAGVSRMQYPSNAIPITVMCSGSISPLYVMSAFNKGADGVLISGCHPGDCHYLEGNYQARRKIYLMKELMEFMGLEHDRFRMSWVSAAEGAKFAEVISDFVEDIKKIGPHKRMRAAKK